MLDIIYNLIVMPIEIVVEIVYAIMSRFLDNKGLAIIFVSLVIQTLILPLYKRADAIQEEENNKHKQMEKWERHIKRTFKKDEKFMMLQTYYNQQNYKVWYSLRSTFSILLQIPFFIAAYNYLSNLSELYGVGFWLINDLSQPDKIIRLGNIGYINLLPILMTIFNLLSLYIYSKGQPVKSKIQGCMLAVVFLFLLYNSPSGLVLYWTCNNLYSLVKNVVFKSKKSVKKDINNANNKSFFDNIQQNSKLVFAEEVFLTVLLGGVIPLATIGTSATEFIIGDSNPIMLAIKSLSVFAGFFIVWFSIFYYLMKEREKKIFQSVLSGICIAAIVNYLFFANKLGTMSTLLIYDNGVDFSLKYNLFNAFIFVTIVIIVTILAINFENKIKNALWIIILAMCVICVVNFSAAKKDMRQYEENIRKKATEDIVTFSKNGTNVIILMLDRATSGYFPFIIDEKPELKESLSGFVYYPNTISFGDGTKIGAPALYGGYEYTPVEINKRSDERLVDKHDEALKVLPKLFSDNKFNVTVCDPPYAGYSWNPDYSIFDGINNLKTYDTMNAYGYKQEDKINIEVQKKNILYYSMCKVLPTMLQERFYHNGEYCNMTKSAFGFSSHFSDWYTALDNFDTMACISNDNSNNCFIIQNSMTHEPIVLKKPDYIPTDEINIENELNKQTKRVVDGVLMYNNTEGRLAHYDSNMAAILLLSKWVNYLKGNDVYDNTRIIVVADHGAGKGGAYAGELQCQLSNLHINGEDYMRYNPILLVKDFNAKGSIKTDDSFMTNADVPSIAVSGIIDNPINPYTGKEINMQEKYAHDQYIAKTYSASETDMSIKTFGNEDADWFIVHDNIFDENNWEIGKCRE